MTLVIKSNQIDRGAVRIFGQTISLLSTSGPVYPIAVIFSGRYYGNVRVGG